MAEQGEQSEPKKPIYTKVETPKNFVPRTPATLKEYYDNRPKCIHHPTSLPTRTSVAKGIPLCFRCDPEWKVKKAQKKADELNGKLGKRRLYLPASIVEFYDRAAVDEDLVALKEDIATWEARIQQLTNMIRLSPYEAPTFIRRLYKKLYSDLEEMKKGRLSYLEIIQNIKAQLDGKITELDMWVDVAKATETKRRLVEAEAKRMNHIGWTPDYCFALVGAITNIIKDMFDIDKVVEFQQRLASDPLFRNQQFRLMPQVDHTQMTIDAAKAELDVVETSQTNGTYEPVEKEAEHADD